MSTLSAKRNAENIPDCRTKKDFWNRWWNRTIKTKDGVDGWNAQLIYFREVIKLLTNSKSTFGFEILNEPEVFEISHYRKVGHYHDYMIKELRKLTDKQLLFCCALPHGVIDNPVLQALTRPTTKENVIYDCHSYPPSLSRMIYFKFISSLMGGIPLYMGELNSGFTPGTTLTQKQFSEYVKRFKKFRTCGWALWRWSYIYDRNIPAFNLSKITENRIEPNIFFTYFKNVLRTTK